MKSYLNFIKEHKFWGKSNAEVVSWIESKSDKYWIWIDTETTGLPSEGYEIQLTQISCIITKWD